MRSAGGGCSGRATTSSRPRRRSRAAWRSIPRARARTSSCGSTRATSTPATAGRSPRATSCASASAPSTRTIRSSSRRCGCVEDVDAEPHGYQGNWIPHRIRPATEDGVFFAGDSAGHCLPLTAEGIRTAFYFGIALGRELRAVLEGRQDRADGAGALPRVQRRRTAGSSRRCTPPSSRSATCTAARWTRSRAFFTRPRVANWAFRHYLDIAPPPFAVPAPPAAARSGGAGSRGVARYSYSLR